MYDTTIPGFCPKPQLELICEIAARTPADGKIVEVGTLFGRSAFCWATSAAKSVSVFCIDIWHGREMVGYVGDSMPEGKPVTLKSTKQLFLDMLIERKIENVIAIQEASPLKGGWSHGPVDLVYIDGAHDHEAVAADLEFWYANLGKNGVLCGDDYLEEFPGVLQAVKEFAIKQGLEIRRYCKMWLLVSPENFVWLSGAYEALLAKQGAAGDPRIPKEIAKTFDNGDGRKPYSAP